MDNASRRYERFSGRNQKNAPISLKLAKQKQAENCKLSEMLNAGIRAATSELTEQVEIGNLDYLPR